MSNKLEYLSIFLIRNNLYKLYGDCNLRYKINEIDNLIYNKKNSIILAFKENLLYYDYKEFLKRFYFIRESKMRLNSLYKHYVSYLIYFCKPILRKYYYLNLLQEANDKKAVIFYQDNYKQNFEKKENCANKEDSSFSGSCKENSNRNIIIFGQNTRRNIEKNSNLPTIITDDINYSNLFESNKSINNYLEEMQTIKKELNNPNFHSNKKISKKNNTNNNSPIIKINNRHFTKKIMNKNKKNIKEFVNISPVKVNSFSLNNDNKFSPINKKTYFRFQNSNSNNKANHFSALYKHIPVNCNIRALPINNNIIINTGSQGNTLLFSEIKQPFISQFSAYKLNIEKSNFVKNSLCKTNMYTSSNISNINSKNLQKNNDHINLKKNKKKIILKNDSRTFFNSYDLLQKFLTSKKKKSENLLFNNNSNKYSQRSLIKSFSFKKTTKNHSFGSSNIKTFRTKVKQNSNLNKNKIKSSNKENNKNKNVKRLNTILNEKKFSEKNKNTGRRINTAKSFNLLKKTKNKLNLEKTKKNLCTFKMNNSNLLGNESNEIKKLHYISKKIGPLNNEHKNTSFKTKKLGLKLDIKKELTPTNAKDDNKNKINKNKKMSINYIISLKNANPYKNNIEIKKVIILNKKFQTNKPLNSNPKNKKNY